MWRDHRFYPRISQKVQEPNILKAPKLAVLTELNADRYGNMYLLGTADSPNRGYRMGHEIRKGQSGRKTRESYFGEELEG